MDENDVQELSNVKQYCISSHKEIQALDRQNRVSALRLHFPLVGADLGNERELGLIPGFRKNFKYCTRCTVLQ